MLKFIFVYGFCFLNKLTCDGLMKTIQLRVIGNLDKTTCRYTKIKVYQHVDTQGFGCLSFLIHMGKESYGHAVPLLLGTSSRPLQDKSSYSYTWLIDIYKALD